VENCVNDLSPVVNPQCCGAFCPSRRHQPGVLYFTRSKVPRFKVAQMFLIDHMILTILLLACRFRVTGKTVSCGAPGFTCDDC